MYLILSTLPHFLSIIPLTKYYLTYAFAYCNLIILSTTFSILYHYHEESNNIITMIDYFFAYIWFGYDIFIGFTYTNPYDLTKIIFANFISFIINIQIPNNKYYIVNHSLWHLLNSCKCIYVTNIIANGFSKYLQKLQLS